MILYRGFNLTLDITDQQAFFEVTDQERTVFKKENQKIQSMIKTKMETELDFPVGANGDIDGAKIMEDWFPNKKADIFISHSHNDRRTAERLAIWLQREMNLSVFIDSVVWGSADELLKKIDNQYSLLREKDGNAAYDYNTRNYTTSHVHMMLSAALSEVIYNSECLIFLNTPHSLSIRESKGQKTNSPWIFNELKIAGTIEKKIPRRKSHLIKDELHHRDIFNKSETIPSFSYPVGPELMKMKSITKSDLVYWHSQIGEKNKNWHPLDILYSEVSSNE